ncbi:hypothetical protein Drorol1_Dr00000060, partial [Drosera rotundifolia]
TDTMSELKRIERLVFGFFVCCELECGFCFEFEELLAVASVLEVKLGNSSPVFEELVCVLIAVNYTGSKVSIGDCLALSSCCN